MIKEPILLALASTLVAAPLTWGQDAAVQQESKQPSVRPATLPELIAVIRPTKKNKVKGTVTFKPLPDGNTEVIARLTGFKPNTEHGFHVHQFGDISAADGSSAGGHFNPKGTSHDLPPETRRHAGDMGNLKADKNGNVSENLILDFPNVHGKNSILGRAVIIHAKADTGKGKSGQAGARIAQGVIGYRFEPQSTTTSKSS